MPMDQNFARLVGNKRLAYMSNKGSNTGKCQFSMNTLNHYLQLWEVLIYNEKGAEAIR